MPAAGAITCRHLLVPVDETDDATTTVVGAIELARMAGACITFMHVPHIPVTVDSDTRVSSAATPHGHLSRSRELLGKAESIARAHGVPCASAGTASQAPHAAILTAAREAGCDLILIGLHGHGGNPGTMPGSLVLAVLAQADIPVLVLPYPAPAMPAPAIRIIRDEQRALSAILRAWLDMLVAAKDSGVAPDVRLMRIMVRFIETLPVARHHPRKQAFLFGRLRRRTFKVDAELDELVRQHQRDSQWASALAETVERYATGGPLTELARTVDHYTQFAWALMGREQGVILPAAQRYLNAGDWDDINASYCEAASAHGGGNQDRPFDALLAYVANLPDADCVARVCRQVQGCVSTC